MWDNGTFDGASVPTRDWHPAQDRYDRLRQGRRQNFNGAENSRGANGKRPLSREVYGGSYVGRGAVPANVPGSSTEKPYLAAYQTPLGPYGWEAYGPGTAYQERSWEYDQLGRVPTEEVVTRANFSGGTRDQEFSMKNYLAGYDTLLLVGGAVFLVIIVGLIIANVTMIVTVSGMLSAMQAVAITTAKTGALA
jgi:hypothetical protein